MDNLNLEFSGRMQQVLEIFNGNVSELARNAGIAPPSAKRWIDGSSDPQMSNLIRLADAAGVNLLWLAKGEGAKFKTDAGINNACHPDPQPEITDTLGNPVDLDEFVFIPRYDVKAAAGNGFPVDNEKPRFSMAFRLYWIKNYLHADPADLSVISVEGDSMEGVLNHRDTILINHAKNRAGNGLYVLRMDNDLIVKRTQVLPNRKLLILSANEAYAPFEIDLNDADLNIEIIGKVEWFGRSV